MTDGQAMVVEKFEKVVTTDPLYCEEGIIIRCHPPSDGTVVEVPDGKGIVKIRDLGKTGEAYALGIPFAVGEWPTVVL